MVHACITIISIESYYDSIWQCPPKRISCQGKSHCKRTLINNRQSRCNLPKSWLPPIYAVYQERLAAHAEPEEPNVGYSGSRHHARLAHTRPFG